MKQSNIITILSLDSELLTLLKARSLPLLEAKQKREIGCDTLIDYHKF